MIRQRRKRERGKKRGERREKGMEKERKGKKKIGEKRGGDGEREEWGEIQGVSVMSIVNLGKNSLGDSKQECSMVKCQILHNLHITIHLKGY